MAAFTLLHWVNSCSGGSSAGVNVERRAGDYWGTVSRVLNTLSCSCRLESSVGTRRTSQQIAAPVADLVLEASGRSSVQLHVFYLLVEEVHFHLI